MHKFTRNENRDTVIVAATHLMQLLSRNSWSELFGCNYIVTYLIIRKFIHKMQTKGKKNNARNI